MNILDHNILLDSSKRDVASYLRQLANRHHERDITRALLEAVQAEVVPPVIMPIWLNLAKASQAVKDALLQDWSITVQKAAIDEIGTRLRSIYWEDIWQSLGGVPGLVDILEILSVHHVRCLTRAIGRSYKHRDDRKTYAITDLFLSLSCKLIPGGSLQSQDDRPLQRCYFDLLPCCNDECVEDVIVQRNLLGYGTLSKSLLASHTALLKRMCLENEIVVRRAIPKVDSLWQYISGPDASAPGLSPSMVFSLELLQKALKSGNENSRTDFDMPAVIASLVPRALKKKTPRLLEIIQLVVNFHASHPKDLNSTLLEHQSTLLGILRVWGQSPKKKVPQFPSKDLETLLFEMIRLTRSMTTSPLSYETLLMEIHKVKRYQLLHQLLLQRERIDIDDDQYLRDWKCDKVSINVFHCLDSVSAVALLHRLMIANPDCKIFSVSDISMYPPQEFLGSHVDCNVLILELSSNDNDVALMAAEKMAERKKVAEVSRDQPTRAFYAETVIVYASLSRQQQVFGNSVTWIKRFQRDPLTVKALYNRSCIASGRIVELLAGLPRYDEIRTSTLDHHATRTKVLAGNDIMLMLFQTAVEAIREPSFHANDWQGVVDLISSVVDLRARLAFWMEKYSAISIDDLFDLIWLSTIDLLVEIERMALSRGNEALALVKPNGIITTFEKSPVQSSRSTLKFYDSLAQKRDDLWKHYRLDRLPACAEMSAPFPRGLPIQCLTWIKCSYEGWSPEMTPYIAARAKNLVFMNVQEAMASLPTDKEMTRAIGPFVDSLGVAMDLFVRQDKDSENRENRLSQARSHWIRLLRQQKHMSERDAELFVFQYLGGSKVAYRDSDSESDTEAPQYPQRPSSTADLDEFEWDPTPGVATLDIEKEYPATVLDCFMRANSGHCTSVSKSFFKPSAWEIVHVIPPVLSVRGARREVGRIDGRIAEGLVLASLLTIDSERKEGARHFNHPFPSGQVIRYPAVYLDSNFLERENVTSTRAMSALDDLIMYVPATLLASMTQQHIESLALLSNSENLAAAEKVAYGLLKRLARCDRPYLASDLIIGIITDRPESSSWHRQLLTISFLRRLPNDMVKKVFKAFTRTIVNKLVTQSTRLSAANSETRVSPIKVTTVKLVTELLREFDYISPSIAVEILGELFQNSNHIDIKTTAVKALFDIFAQTKGTASEALIEAIIESLKPIVPLLGALNERYILSEEQWQTMETSFVIDEQTAPSTSQDRLIFEVLTSRNLSDSMTERLFTEIMLPAVEIASLNNTRILHLILRKHGFNSDEVETVLPFKITRRLLDKYSDRLPRLYLEKHHKLIMLNIEPTATILNVTAKLRSTKDLIDSVEGRIWFSFFGDGVKAAYETANIARLLVTDLPLKHSTKISMELVQHCIVEQARTLLRTLDDPEFVLWKHFEGSLGPGTYSRTTDPAATLTVWTHNALPVIRAVINAIDDLRSEEWKRNPQRKPSVLPSTLSLRSWLLDLPVPATDNVVDNTQLELFAQRLFEFSISSVDVSSETHANALQTAVRVGKAVRNEYFVRLMCYMGILCANNIGEGNHVYLSLLWVEVVCKQMSTYLRSYKDEETVELVKRMTELWKGSWNEELRMHGLRDVKLDEDTW